MNRWVKETSPGEYAHRVWTASPGRVTTDPMSLREIAFMATLEATTPPGGLMPDRYPLFRLLAVAAVLALAAPVAVVASLSRPADAATVTTAWGSGSFSVNPGGV